MPSGSRLRTYVDGVASEPVVVEVEFGAAARAYEAFERWAGTSDVVVLFEPETVMAVDRPCRRGFLYDKVYFVTIWASASSETSAGG